LVSPPPEAQDDSVWVSRCKAGDPDAFEPLVLRHAGRIRRLVWGLLGEQREDAEDVVQEIFLKAYLALPRFREDARFSTWLYRIAVNHCLNRLRRRRIARFLPFGGTAGGGESGDDEAPAFDPPDEAADPEAALDSRRRWQRVRRAIDALPPGQRAVLVLVRFEGLAYKEAADALGITVGAVESRLVRALRHLDAALAQGSGPPGVPRTRRTR
jgi:RNA polymerase sigma-70 factor (ECF subfamily)